MMRLDINLATQPYEDGRRFWMRWGPLLGVAGLVTLIMVITTITSWAAAHKDQVQISEFKDQIAKCDQERGRAQEILDRPENRSTRDQSKFINGLIQRKSFSWTQVFSDLEKMMPPELHVTAIHPEVAKNNQLQVKLSVAGKSRDRALQLVHRMEQSPRFNQPEVKEESTGNGPNGDNSHFEIGSAYIPQIEPAALNSDKTGGAKGNNSKPTGEPAAGKSAPKSSSPKPAGPKAMPAKPGLPKPAALKGLMPAQGKGH